jgi:hypothetical protein
MNETISGEPTAIPQEKGWYVQTLLVSVYTVPSLVVYTGTQNRPRIE